MGTVRILSFLLNLPLVFMYSFNMGIVPPSPPILKLKPGGDWNGHDIKLLTNDQAKMALSIWSSKPEWEKQDIRKMLIALDKVNSSDMYLAYCPFYDNRQNIRYIFRTRITEKNNTKVLSVLSGVLCPFDDSMISSVKFIKHLQNVIPDIPVDIEPIKNDFRFKMSWEFDI